MSAMKFSRISLSLSFCSPSLSLYKRKSTREIACDILSFPEEKKGKEKPDLAARRTLAPLRHFSFPREERATNGMKGMKRKKKKESAWPRLADCP